MKNKIDYILILSVVISLTAGVSQRAEAGPTKVSGIIRKNTTWTLADSPIIITDKTRVAKGVTLKIDPGVEVRFDGSYNLTIEGELLAQGTANQRIKFTSNKLNPQRQDWWGSIEFTSLSVPAIFDNNGNYVSGSILSYADISFGGASPYIGASASVLISNSSPYIANNLFNKNGISIAIEGGQNSLIIKNNLIENSEKGITAKGINGLNIQNNVIRKSYLTGLAITEGSGLIKDNVISQNRTTGLRVYSGDFKIHHNVIVFNCTAALGLHEVPFWPGKGFTVEFNTLQDNITGGGSIACDTSAPIKINHNNISNPTTENNAAVYEVYLTDKTDHNAVLDATNNYWGTTDMQVIEERTWDQTDDINLAKVSLQPILMAPENGAPVFDSKMIDPMYCACDGTAGADTDGDGWADCNDNCPNDKNKQAPGICGCGVADTDTDMDGTADCKDLCPNDKNKKDPGVCGCGIPDTGIDTDKDGTPDCKDLCPNDPHKIAPGLCGCGGLDDDVGSVDSDGDGVINCKDKCPNTPKGTLVFTDGCPPVVNMGFPRKDPIPANALWDPLRDRPSPLRNLWNGIRSFFSPRRTSSVPLNRTMNQRTTGPVRTTLPGTMTPVEQAPQPAPNLR